MITTLTGGNSLEMRKRLNEMLGDFKNEHGELAIERFDGEETSFASILEAVQSPSFLAEKKLVIIRGLSANKDATENIEQFISSVLKGVDVVLVETSPDKRTAFYKALKRQTQFEEFSNSDPKDLPKWLLDYAKSRGGELGVGEANYLVERVGGNQQLLASEVDKLITYDSQINRANIDLLTEKTPQSKIFDLLDAAFGGNKRRALQIYEEQRAQKVEPQEIMAMLAWQLRLIVFAKLAGSKPAAEIAKDTGMNPYPITKAQSLAAKLTGVQLRKMVSDAKKIDRLAKTKSVDLDEALKSYIATI